MLKNEATILVINPGTTSTKVAVFRGDREIHKRTIEYSADELQSFDLAEEQFDFRRKGIEGWIAQLSKPDRSFDAIAGRGAPLKPLEGGTYTISGQMLEDVRASKYSNHASNLGPLLADHFARKYDIPAYITDPITVDNFSDVARISGFPGIVRRCRSHALNIKAVGRYVAAELGRNPEETSFIIAHMGNGISVAAVAKSRIIDVNDGLLGMGPFSPDRAGALPIGALVNLCYSGEYDKEALINVLSKKSGFMGYLGVNDLRRVEEMIDDGNSKAKLIFDAMCYQIAKEIGAAGAALKGKVDRVIFTGGMAHSERLTKMISSYVEFIAPVRIIPGEHEMRALYEGAIRALTDEETAKTYD
jgi:butyrate kinase